MTPEQKQRIAHEISNWRNARNDHSAQLTGDRMAALLQELIDAPEPVPVAWRYEDAFGTHFTEDYSEISNIPGVLSFTALFAAPPHQSEQHLEMVNTPAPSVPDGLQTIPSHDQLTKILNGLDRCVSAESRRAFLRTWIRDWTAHKLSAAPTPAEAPAQDFEDALEQAFWDFDARHKGYKKTIRPISERDAFKQVLRNFMHEHGGAEAPADVARDAARLDWLDAQCSENNGRHICCLPGGLRVAIDAAMHEKGQS